MRIPAIVTYIDTLNEYLGRAVAWLTTALMVLVCADVVVRYLLNDSANWVMELEWHLFALIFLLGAGYTLKHDRHVRVDLFYTRFSVRDQALVNFIGHLLFLLPWCVLLVWAGWSYTLEAFYDGESSPNPGGLAYFWPIKLAIPLGIGLLGLQGVAELIRAGYQYRYSTTEDDS